MLERIKGRPLKERIADWPIFFGPFICFAFAYSWAFRLRGWPILYAFSFMFGLILTGLCALLTLDEWRRKDD